jgi:hypothetical protein
MKLILVAIVCAGMAWPISLSQQEAPVHPTEPWTTLRRVPEMEAFTGLIFRLAGRTYSVPVVIDPAAKGYCGYATARGDTEHIGLDIACTGPLKIGGTYNWKAAAVLSHEVAHIQFRHVHQSSNSSAQETSADEFAGEMMFRLGAPLEDALALPLQFDREGTDIHPGRSIRVESFARGWMRAQGGGRRAPRGPIVASNVKWWADLMSMPLPWAR